MPPADQPPQTELNPIRQAWLAEPGQIRRAFRARARGRRTVAGKGGAVTPPATAVPMTLRYRRGPSLRTRSRLYACGLCTVGGTTDRVMAQADAPPLYWSEDLADADWAGAAADPRSKTMPGKPGAARSPSRRSSSPDRPTSAFAGLCETETPSRCAKCCPHDRGVRPPPRPRRPAAGTYRRTRRPVTAGKPAEIAARPRARSARNTPMSRAYRFRHATAPSQSPSLSVVGALTARHAISALSARTSARCRSRCWPSRFGHSVGPRAGRAGSLVYVRGLTAAGPVSRGSPGGGWTGTGGAAWPWPWTRSAGSAPG